MHINLADGKIDAFNFTLTANGSGGKILIDSEGSIPLKIGDNFQVGWDGKMIATSATLNSATINTMTATKNTRFMGSSFLLFVSFLIGSSFFWKLFF